ncbi:MAG: HU family DNA-binding protein [Mycoplasma sp.]|nr:HU family DNA-binding protein [Mycoplasma sp.]
MNKAQMVEALADKLSITKADAEKAMSAFIELTVSSVNAGKKVAIPGLGSFEKVKRAARQGINPQTGEKIQIKAKNAPKFKAAKAFKDLVA